MKWRQAYESGWIILADRYTTSNMVHQAVKLKDPAEREEFLTWLWDFEFGRLQLPVPDRVIYLDMPPEISDRLINSRAAKDSSRKRTFMRRIPAISIIAIGLIMRWLKNMAGLRLAVPSREICEQCRIFTRMYIRRLRKY